MADLNNSNGTYKGRKTALDSSSSNCSVSDLQSILNLSQATARIEREVQSSQFAGTSQGQRDDPFHCKEYQYIGYTHKISVVL